MSDEPIDINRARMKEAKDQDIKDFISSSYHKILDTYNTISMRTVDIQKDINELHEHMEALITELHEKYPDLIPGEEYEDSFDDN